MGFAIGFMVDFFIIMPFFIMGFFIVIFFFIMGFFIVIFFAIIGFFIMGLLMVEVCAMAGTTKAARVATARTWLINFME
jgi:hypothetical protein